MFYFFFYRKHSSVRKQSKKNPDLGVLEDPVFQGQGEHPQAMKFLELHEGDQRIVTTSSLLRGQRQSSTMHTRSRLSSLPAAPNVYNVPQDEMWLKTNNEKEVALKSRDSHQELPLWDPYWQKHTTAMPTFLSGAIANNAYLHFKNSPFDLYWRNVYGACFLFFLFLEFLEFFYFCIKKNIKNIYLYILLRVNVNLTADSTCVCTCTCLIPSLFDLYFFQTCTQVQVDHQKVSTFMKRVVTVV